MIRKYRLKTRVIEAIQFNGTMTQELTNFLEDFEYRYQETIGGTQRLILGDDYDHVLVSEYIIKDDTRKIYALPPGIFEKMYEPVDNA